MKNSTKFFEVDVKEALVRVPGAFPFFEHFVSEELLHISKINDPAARARAAFPILRVLGGKKYAEIARILGVSPSTVRSWPRNRRVARACEEMASRFGGQFVGRATYLVHAHGGGCAEPLFRELAAYAPELQSNIILRFETERDVDLMQRPTPENEARWAEVDRLLAWVKSGAIGPKATPEGKARWAAFEKKSAIENQQSEVLRHLAVFFESGRISRREFIAVRNGLDVLAGLARDAVADAEHWHVKFLRKGKRKKNGKK